MEDIAGIQRDFGEFWRRMRDGEINLGDVGYIGGGAAVALGGNPLQGVAGVLGALRRNNEQNAERNAAFLARNIRDMEERAFLRDHYNRGTPEPNGLRPLTLGDNSSPNSGNMATPNRTPGRRITGSVRSTPRFTPSSGGRFRRSRNYRIRKKFKYRVKKSSFKKKRRAFVKKLKRKMKKKKLNKYLAKTKGYEQVHETYGSVSDGYCVYIKHSTHYIEHIAYAITGALVRKLFAKAGYTIRDNNEVLSFYGMKTPNVSSVDYHLGMVTVDPAANDYAGGTETQLDFGTFSTLDAIATGWTSMINHITNVMLNNTQSELVKITLLIDDDDGSNTGPKVIAELPMQDLDMHMSCMSILKVQNRTLNVSGTNNSDVGDNQPVHGKLFTFRNMDPRLSQPHMKSQGNTGANDVKVTGIAKHGVEVFGAQYLLPESYKAVPSSSIFRNCVKSSKVVMPVGETQQSVLKWKSHGPFTSFLERFRPSRGVTTPDADIKMWEIPTGKSQLLAVEEIIQTDASNQVKIGYERKFSCGVWFTSKNKVKFRTPWASSAETYIPTPP